MVCVTRLNGKKFYVNADLIQFVEGTPDTVITLTNEVKIVVKESPQEIVAEIIDYQHQVRSDRSIARSGV